MKIIFIIFFALISILNANFIARADKNCPAWNNLAHSRNIDNLYIYSGEKYKILRDYKGQYLIKIDSPSIKSQRWVDKECFSTQNSTKEDISTNNIDSILALSWHNSFCKTHPNKKECRPLYNYGKNHLVLHGLWPDKKSYCNVAESLIEKDKKHQWRALPEPLTYNIIRNPEFIRYFPGILSGLEKHEWIKHGTCYTNNPKEYFTTAVNLTKEVDNSMVGEYLRANIGAIVNIVNLRKIFEKSFGRGNGNKLAMLCKKGFLTEIRISLHGRGQRLKEMLKNAKSIHSRCIEGRVSSF